jgi:Zn-dependent peptidase ImmA (M78 family)
MERPRIGFARQVARGILKHCGIQKPPVDIQQIVSKLGYTYIEVPTFPDNVGAVFLEHDGEQYAAVNANHGSQQKRFSVAHEIGHIRMGHNSEYHDEPSSLDNPPTGETHSERERAFEREANAFAAELLVPLEMLKVEFKKTQDIDALAEVFFVSTHVIT